MKKVVSNRSGSAETIALVASNARLFKSFFDEGRTRRLSELTSWKLSPATKITPALRKSLRSVEVLITTWDSPAYFPEELLQWAPSLRLIAHCGGEVKTRFARPLFGRIVISNAPPPAQPVAELAVTLLLYMAREIDYYRNQLRSSSNAIYDRLHADGGGDQTIIGRQIGLIGFGRIGRCIADFLAPYGVRLLVHDPYVDPPSAPSFVRFAPLDEVIASSQYLILAAGLTSETNRMLNSRTLRTMPKGAAIINVGRGGMIDLDALTRMVLSGRLRCALDVTDPYEPLPLRHPLRRAEGAIIVPHIGACPIAARQAMASMLLSDMERFLSGKPAENRVTEDMLDRMT